MIVKILLHVLISTGIAMFVIGIVILSALSLELLINWIQQKK